MTGAGEAGAGPGGHAAAPLLPAAVRARVVTLAADRLGALKHDQLPSSLRAFARFTPGKRARLAAVPLAAALESDVVFRQHVADGLREALPELAEAVASGSPLPAAPPEDLAAAVYVLRPPGWRERLAQAVAELAAHEDAAAGAVQVDAVRRLTEQLEALRAGARVEAERLRAEAEAARAEAVAVRRRLREVGDRAGRAEAAQRAAEQALLSERAALARAREQAQEQVRRAEAGLAEAHRAAAAGRQSAREGRSADELRLRVLLDALLGAAAGLRRELALPPADGRPADALTATYGPGEVGPPSLQGRDPDNPALLDALLAVPLVHLLVDGYNVTKGGYGDLPLEAQRSRLLTGLGALAARTGAEVTVVFDGSERRTVLAVAAPRGVRLLFSREGETADEVLRHLVRHEPGGRPLVVVSTDREVADGVRAAGAQAVPSRALLRLLGRV
ncbi:MAG TPA: NYN domain-containing protein [Mycobacteriales bacterium]|nr:NYN domain-containing protein [Mycobacteriales bacterium]